MDYHIEFLLKILVCFLLSACIGVERQFRGRKAGLRTVILVSLGSFLFVNFSFEFPKSDTTRIAAQVVAGIGFLGAGVIIKDSKNVKGLTTAATLWCSAAIGILCAANLLFEAATGTLFILFTNIVLRSLNRRINLLSGKGTYNVYHFSITCDKKDLDKLQELTKEVIKDNEGRIDSTEITTLDNNERILSSSDIVITNEKEAIGLAGVMGGLSTEIESTTKNVVIESAIFRPINIRNTSKKILRSEASSRYEKGLDVNRCYFAIERACTLLSMYASAKVYKGMLEYNTLDRNNKEIEITLDKINSVLGYKLSVDDVLDVFRKLKFDVKENKNVFKVSVPTRRTDISIIEDLIEEVGRIYGVDNIESTLPDFETSPGNYDKRPRLVRNIMSSMSLNEVITYSLINEKDVFKFTNDEFGLIQVSSPLSEDKTTLRHSLITSLLSVYDYNKARNIKDLGIFELGKSFSKINGEIVEESVLCALVTGRYNEGIEVRVHDFYTLKGIVEELLERLGYKNRYTFEVREFPCEMNPYQSAYININGTIVGYFGKVHPSLYKEDIYVMEINLDTLFSIKSGKIKFREFTKYPSITKDLSFIVNKDVLCDDIILTIRKNGKGSLKSVNASDYYEDESLGENKKAITFKLTFESFDKTLTDEEVNPIIENVVSSVIKNHNGVLRDK